MIATYQDHAGGNTHSDGSHPCETLILEQARVLLDMQKSTEDQSQKIAALELQIDKLIKQLYGQKSERSVDDPNQLTLNFGEDE